MIKEGYLWNRKWFWIITLLALSLLLSYMQPLQLKEGGEVTCLSMMILCLAGYFYGGPTGLFTCFCFGAIKYVLDYPGIINVPEVWDYLLGYGVLGLG